MMNDNSTMNEVPLMADLLMRVEVKKDQGRKKANKIG
jgi:hypothetical protein